ncbi:hypothetical protein LNQ81_10360 [Myroides sp. M-43]|uniref:hypothetical protein n=1 Tax=Myroides oncorhynchi TaxID=2893756 RepID=UPI001E325EFD|nr:hypothetical protein [Myroides oncorhynchi]MCC9043077.1 hypothetical protein [Myroides oncorhynchi]
MKIFLFVTIVIVLVGCNSHEDDYPKIEKEFKLSDQLYTKKVIIVESLLEKTGGEKDDEPYDFYAIEHRKYIEST